MVHVSEMSASEVRAEWARVLRTARAGQPVTVTQHGEPAAVIIDIETYRRLRTAQEAAEDAEDDADVTAAVQARARIAEGQAPVSLTQFAAQIAELVTPAVLAEVRAELYRS
jgi:prevent-host-death family protein